MRYIIIGCGRWGAGLSVMLSHDGHQVVTVDRDPGSFARLGPAFKGRTIVGDGVDRAVLEEAGIKRADGLAAVTHADEINIVAARAAKQIYRVPKVVARLYDPNKAEVYRRLGLQTVAPVQWGVSRVAEVLRYDPFDTALTLGGGGVDLKETEIPSALAGRTVRDVTVPGEIVVVAITRGGRTFLPTLGATFAEGDHVSLAVQAGSAGRLSALFGMA